MSEAITSIRTKITSRKGTTTSGRTRTTCNTSERSELVLLVGLGLVLIVLPLLVGEAHS